MVRRSILASANLAGIRLDPTPQAAGDALAAGAVFTIRDDRPTGARTTALQSSAPPCVRSAGL